MGLSVDLLFGLVFGSFFWRGRDWNFVFVGGSG